MKLVLARWIPKDLNMRRVYFFTGLGIVVGFLLVSAVRFAMVRDDSTHYHANFALYINGEQEKFANPFFYEEVAICAEHEHVSPKQRVHLHDNVPYLVHVHDEGVTWGHLLANLGYGLTDKLVQTDKGIFIDGKDSSELKFFLNGKFVDSVDNTLIGNEDTLLIDYGKSNDERIKKEFEAIPRDARQANTTQDPASCAGEESLTFSGRLKRAFNFTD